MNSRILFIVDNLPRAQFFGRFAPVCHEQGVATRYLAYRRSSHRYLLSLGLDSRLLKNRLPQRPVGRGDRQIESEITNDVRQSLEVASGDASFGTVFKSAFRIAGQIESAIDSYSPTHLFLWNGSQFVERLASRFCPGEVAKRFFEISNFPGRIFVDPQGVNAASSLYASPDSLLTGGIPPELEFRTWKTAYLQAQRSRSVPQAKVAKAMQWERPIDSIASRLGQGFYPMSARSMFSRFVGKLSHSAAATTLIDEYRRPPGMNKAYRFFPLQVSGDTQLLLNSDIGNLEALSRVIRACQGDQIDLVVKIHPAENNQATLVELRRLLSESRHGCSVYLSDEPTTELIQGAEKVYTINSTVGLETLIADRPLEVFGRAFYQHFIGRPELLRAYLLRYLVSFDYFDTTDASEGVLHRVLSGLPGTKSHRAPEMAVGS